MAKTNKPKPGTKFSLTQKEKSILTAKKFLLDNLNYLFSSLGRAISADMMVYVDEEVKKRLDLETETLVDVNIQEGTLIIADPNEAKEGSKIAEA